MPKPYAVTVEIKGTIMGVRKIQDRGRIQIPKEVREEIGLNEGDGVYWVKHPDGRFYIVRAMDLEGKILL